jgi:CNT family concentrative nucleoside transporter
VDAPVVASLMGVKTVLNEFVAYIQLANVLGGEHQLQPRSIVIATYALSGFANFSSIAIQLGGIGGIAPSRRHDLSRLGLRAMIAGSIAAFMTATVAGMIL